MVLAVHLELFQAVPGPRALRALFWSGWSGVDLFFVLSGFLITGILLDSFGSPNFFSRFYRRRALRILPLYYAICAVLFFAVPLIPGSAWKTVFPTATGWFSYLLFLQNWWMPRYEDSHRLIGHLWSLGVEEQFYLLWPACVFLLTRKQLRWTCGGALVFCLALRILTESHMPGFALMNTATRIDTLLVGAFCALAVRDAALAARVKRWLPAVALASFVSIAAIDLVAHEIWSRAFYTSTIGFTCFALFYGSLLLWAYWQDGSKSLLDRALGQRWLRRIGTYSYGIYVLHLPVFYAGRFLAPRAGVEPHGLLYCTALLAVTWVLAAVSFEFLEKPMLAWRREIRTFRARPRLVVWMPNKSRFSDSVFGSAARLDETGFEQYPRHHR